MQQNNLTEHFYINETTIILEHKMFILWNLSKIFVTDYFSKELLSRKENNFTNSYHQKIKFKNFPITLINDCL